MKLIPNIFLVAAASAMLTGCNDAAMDKETYLNTRLPMLKKNLSESEYNRFMQVMQFDKHGNLNAMDYDLLKKGTGDKLDSVQYRIHADMQGFYSDITMVDSLGLENKLTPDLVVYTTRDGKAVNIDELTKANTIYLITSVNCGPCMQFFKEGNKIASDPANKDFQFVALYSDPAIRLVNYQKGSRFQRFGLLDEHWLQFDNEQNIIREIKQMYKGKSGDFEIGTGFPELFYYQEGKMVRNGNAHQLQEVVNDLKKTLATNAPKPLF
ncbi:hypothetical protein [Flavobacterium sp. JP2137]|uniref:hypothetical protein n=1 Tax=Flavobacterium sp. JP2137 TaxID=3414510 RepID=UPI003D300639